MSEISTTKDTELNEIIKNRRKTRQINPNVAVDSQQENDYIERCIYLAGSILADLLVHRKLSTDKVFISINHLDSPSEPPHAYNPYPRLPQSLASAKVWLGGTVLENLLKANQPSALGINSIKKARESIVAHVKLNKILELWAPDVSVDQIENEASVCLDDCVEALSVAFAERYKFILGLLYVLFDVAGIVGYETFISNSDTPSIETQSASANQAIEDYVRNNLDDLKLEALDINAFPVLLCQREYLATLENRAIYAELSPDEKQELLTGKLMDMFSTFNKT